MKKQPEKPSKWAELDAAAAELRRLRKEVDPAGKIFMQDTATRCPCCGAKLGGTRHIKQEYFDKVYPKQEKKKRGRPD